MAPSIVYILSARKYLSSKASREAFGSTLEIIEVLDVIEADCRSARDSVMTDFKDALISFSAKRYEASFIVTRNKRDFAKSPVPSLTPEEFVTLYKPTCLSYEMANFC